MPKTVQQDRRDLAMAIRLAEKFGLHEGICNHFSVRLDEDPERYLINAYGLHWSETGPDDLLLIDGEGRILEGSGEVEDTALHIHVAAHRANPRHKAVLHTHMPWATALTMLEDGELEMAHQTAVKFYGRTAYQKSFGGLALSGEEGSRLAQLESDTENIDITFLANHGVVVSGASVAMAFDDLYYLERACRQQLIAQSSLRGNMKLRLIPQSVIDLTSRQMAEQQEVFADAHFDALCRVLENNPDKQFLL